ncbi:MAG: XRE family transcriptional regulator [Proteobacteria bacterium]|jgi:transcriptional regulator with XRE-family HTH domain|nr:XRE family transcriptional regulator [Pseudomonadota bacterium]
MALKHIVAKQIKTVRLQMGLTQAELARRAGISIRYLSRLETEPQNLSLDVLEEIAKALRMSPADLLSLQKSKKPDESTPESLIMEAQRLLDLAGHSLKSR